MLEIQRWAPAVETLPQSGLGRAIAYMGGLWDGVRVFLAVNIDNTGTERALRGLVLGRNSHFGSRSRRGGDRALEVRVRAADAGELGRRKSKELWTSERLSFER